MADPEWIEIATVKVAHDRSIALHGGLPGLREEGLLESALERPKYEAVDDLIVLAATYCVAVASNHPFADGNKRAAFLCLLLFLRLNGHRLDADRVDATQTVLKVSSGDMDIPTLATWVRANLAPL
jgi:death-on-curing protein